VKQQRPFPDKSFYVFDGKPFCEYHYHEANNSLCASPRCGLPIEGPCAVSHNGDRYHPAHFLCEFRGGQGCKANLDGEYWELEGLRLCDRHAREHPAWHEDTDQSEYDDATTTTTTTIVSKRATRLLALLPMRTLVAGMTGGGRTG
jgi:hypothetical protein